MDECKPLVTMYIVTEPGTGSRARTQISCFCKLVRARFNADCASTEAPRTSSIRPVHVGRRGVGYLGARWPVEARRVVYVASPKEVL